MPDNWKNRAKHMRCGTCMFYVPKKGGRQIKVGRCRRHAPTLNGWPVMYETDWCGDFKLSENKIETI